MKFGREKLRKPSYAKPQQIDLSMPESLKSSKIPEQNSIGAYSIDELSVLREDVDNCESLEIILSPDSKLGRFADLDAKYMGKFRPKK